MQLKVCLDLEGVLVPEIWELYADHTQIDELAITTRDVRSVWSLFQRRFRIMKQHGLSVEHLLAFIDTIEPFDGAAAFLEDLKSLAETVIITDTCDLFLPSLQRKLHSPDIISNSISYDAAMGMCRFIERETGDKKSFVQRLQSDGYAVCAVGDSFNDIEMLREADAGFLFRPSETVRRVCSDMPVCQAYDEVYHAVEMFVHGWAEKTSSAGTMSC